MSILDEMAMFVWYTIFYVVYYWNRLLCILGFHKWEKSTPDSYGIPMYQYCVRMGCNEWEMTKDYWNYLI